MTHTNNSRLKKIKKAIFLVEIYSSEVYTSSEKNLPIMQAALDKAKRKLRLQLERYLKEDEANG